MIKDSTMLPSYKSKRIVKAGKICKFVKFPKGPTVEIEVIISTGNSVHLDVDKEIMTRNGFGIGAYLVVYDDGYCGICPEKQFEEGYDLIT